MATDANGCEVEAVILGVVAMVESMANNHLSLVFPTPVDETLYLRSEKLSSNSQVVIYNMPGERMANCSRSTSKHDLQTIEVGALPPVFFWLEIPSDNELYR